MTTEQHVKEILENKKYFQNTVYTDLESSIEEFKIRNQSQTVEEQVSTLLPQGIPLVLTQSKGIPAIIFRHMATPNYELIHFMSEVKKHPSLDPYIFEYTEDKFNDRNDAKHNLGKLRFKKGVDKHKNPIMTNLTIINFNQSNNLPLNTIKTKWGEDFVTFHHKLFDEHFKEFTKRRFDLSHWIKQNGGAAEKYYKPFLSLFIKDAVLFENFHANDKEHQFTEDVILPSFLKIIDETALKPLVVKLVPEDEQQDPLWDAYPYTISNSLPEASGFTKS